MLSQSQQTLYLAGSSSSDNFAIIQLNATNGDEIASYETSISCQNVTCSVSSDGAVFFCFVGQDNGDSTTLNTHAVKFNTSSMDILSYSNMEFNYTSLEFLVLNSNEVYYYYSELHDSIGIDYIRLK